MKKRYLVLLILCCLMVIPLVGCSNKNNNTQAKAKTPIQLLTDRVNESDTKDASQDQSLFDLSNRITNEIAAVSQYDDAPITARITALESLGFSNVVGNLSFLTIRVASLESYNISARLTAIEARLNISATPTPTVTPTPTPLNCGVGRPSVISPTSGNMSIINGTVLFEWSNCANAVRYEFWFGSDAGNMILAKNLSAPVTFYAFPVPLPNTYYFWKVVSISPCNLTESDAWWFKTAP